MVESDSERTSSNFERFVIEEIFCRMVDGSKLLRILGFLMLKLLLSCSFSGDPTREVHKMMKIVEIRYRFVTEIFPFFPLSFLCFFLNDDEDE